MGNQEGHYSRLGERTGSQSCQTPTIPPPAIPFCTVMPLFDPATTGGFPAAFNTVCDTPGETITFSARRQASHWGAAFEIEMPLWGASGAPRSASASSLSITAGPAYRRLGHEFDPTARGVSLAGTSTGSVSYSERLSTDFWGGYVGARGQIALGQGFSIGLDGEVGLYHAHAEYVGRSSASGVTHSGNPAANLNQMLSLRHTELAVRASLKVSAEQDFGACRLGGFVRGDYYSFAPAVAYNDTDFTGGVGQNLVGYNNGTSLAAANARAVTVGVRIVVPLSTPAR